MKIIVSPYEDGNSDIIDDPSNHHFFDNWPEALCFMDECFKKHYNVALTTDEDDEE